MAYDDDIKSAITAFATAKTRNAEENQKFSEEWEQLRSEAILPLLEVAERLFNEQSGTTGVSAQAKNDNGSTLLSLAEGGKEIGQITFSASSRRIVCWTHFGGNIDPKSETFDIDKLDRQKIEATVASFIKSFLSKRAPKQ